MYISIHIRRKSRLFLFIVTAILCVGLMGAAGVALADDERPPQGIESRPPVEPDRSSNGPLPDVAMPSARRPESAAASAQSAGRAQAPRDMRVLVIAGDAAEPNYKAITAFLNQIGIPNTSLIASTQRLTPAMLSAGDHGFYYAVILTTSNLAFFNPTSRQWESAFDPDEWDILWSYEADFNIRQVTFYTYPNSLYGLRLERPVDTTTTPLAGRLTETGRQVFFYLNSARPLDIRYAYTYLASPVDPATVPLLTTANGEVLAAIYRSPDGRENLALMVANGPDLIHSLALSYGVINWVTRGLFVGERHVYLNPQVQEFFLANTLWDTQQNSSSTGPVFRMSDMDLERTVAWQRRIQSTRPVAKDFRLELAFSGQGTTGIYEFDSLTPDAAYNQAAFKWVSRTFAQGYLDGSIYSDSRAFIELNRDVADRLHLTTLSDEALVTPNMSGLYNTEFMRAASHLGTKYVLGVATRPWEANPAPNVGIFNWIQPDILIIPAHPTNLYHNVSTPEEWVSEYNYYYLNYWLRNLHYSEILDYESEVILRYLLRYDIDPILFYQANLRAYDGTHSVLSDLLDSVIARYSALYTLPIASPTMQQIGRKMAARTLLSRAWLSATLEPGRQITLYADKDVQVPLTGISTGENTEVYGGQSISYVNLTAGVSVTVPYVKETSFW